MCKPISMVSVRQGGRIQVHYAGMDLRTLIGNSNCDEYPDSHSYICTMFSLDEDKCFKWEIDAFDKIIRIDSYPFDHLEHPTREYDLHYKAVMNVCDDVKYGRRFIPHINWDLVERPVFPYCDVFNKRMLLHISDFYRILESIKDSVYSFETELSIRFEGELAKILRYTNERCVKSLARMFEERTNESDIFTESVYRLAVEAIGKDNGIDTYVSRIVMMTQYINAGINDDLLGNLRSLYSFGVYPFVCNDKGRAVIKFVYYELDSIDNRKITVIDELKLAEMLKIQNTPVSIKGGE